MVDPHETGGKKKKKRMECLGERERRAHPGSWPSRTPSTSSVYKQRREEALSLSRRRVAVVSLGSQTSLTALCIQ